MPTTSHIILPSPSSDELRSDLKPPCDGRNCIRRIARILASEGDQRSLFDFHILDARLFIACSFDNRARRSASCHGSRSCRASTDKTLRGNSSSSQSEANRKASYFDSRRETSVISHLPSFCGLVDARSAYSFAAYRLEPFCCCSGLFGKREILALSIQKIDRWIDPFPSVTPRSPGMECEPTPASLPSVVRAQLISVFFANASRDSWQPSLSLSSSRSRA